MFPSLPLSLILMRLPWFLPLLLASLLTLACQSGSAPAAKVTQLQQQVDSLMNQTPYRPGFIHTVFFWLDEGLSPAERATFPAELEKLTTIETIRQVYIGPPANSAARDVVDGSYDYALIVHFDDLAGHDIYQDHPTHLAFIEANQAKWTRVRVYDTTIAPE